MMVCILGLMMCLRPRLKRPSPSLRMLRSPWTPPLRLQLWLRRRLCQAGGEFWQHPADSIMSIIVESTCGWVGGTVQGRCDACSTSGPKGISDAVSKEDVARVLENAPKELLYDIWRSSHKSLYGCSPQATYCVSCMGLANSSFSQCSIPPFARGKDCSILRKFAEGHIIALL